jgi:hypothetical protein
MNKIYSDIQRVLIEVNYLPACTVHGNMLDEPKVVFNNALKSSDSHIEIFLGYGYGYFFYNSDTDIS